MKKNVYLYACLGVLFAFTVAYFVIANNISYAFVYNETQENYNNKINQIEFVSEIYAKTNGDLFKEKDTIYITVDDLVNAGLIEADSEGIVEDPTSNIKNLNSLKIRITKNKDEYKVKILK